MDEYTQPICKDERAPPISKKKAESLPAASESYLVWNAEVWDPRRSLHQRFHVGQICSWRLGRPLLPEAQYLCHSS